MHSKRRQCRSYGVSKTMKFQKKYLAFSLACALATFKGMADPVWHCSKNQYTDSQTQALNAQADQFSIASFNSSSEVIGVSVRDLMDVYTGNPVHIGGLPLSACFLISDETLTTSALTSLGIQSMSAQALAKKSSIVQSTLHIVQSEQQMFSCVAKNFPAVGYASKPTVTSSVSPCF